MTLDVFVHPDFAVRKKETKRHILNYHDDLLEIRRKSEFSVLLSQGQDCRWNKHFRFNNTYQTLIIDYDDDNILNRRHTGYVMGKDWKDFTSHLNGHDEIRVHGSFLGQCILSFTRQLQAYISNGTEVAKYSGQEVGLGIYLDLICGNVVEIERNGGFIESKIKLGVVLRRDHDKSDEAYSIGPCTNYPYGNYVFQLSDHKTKIHGKENVFRK